MRFTRSMLVVFEVGEMRIAEWLVYSLPHLKSAFLKCENFEKNLLELMEHLL